MAGKTNYTPILNSKTPDFGPDMTSVFQHFDPLIGETVANAAALPASGNWPHRTIMTLDTGAIYVRNQGNTAWRLVHYPWTDYTPTIPNGTLTFGRDYAKFSAGDGEGRVELGFTRSGTQTISDPTISIPTELSFASWRPDTAPAGDITYVDANGGVAGRLRGAVFQVGAGLRIFYLGTNGAQNVIGATSPFNIEAGDKLLISARFPIA